MVDDRPEDTGPSPDTGRARREPPTIDLEATEVSGDTEGLRRRRARPEPEPEPSPPPPAAAGVPLASLEPLSGCRCGRAGAWRRLVSRDGR